MQPQKQQLQQEHQKQRNEMLVSLRILTKKSIKRIIQPPQIESDHLKYLFLTHKEQCFLH